MSIMQHLRFRHAAIVLILLILVFACAGLFASNGGYRQSPHGSTTDGVLRTNEYPRGSCAQCHKGHDDGTGRPYGLFQENSNDLCMAQSMGGCHADKPSGGTAGYPAQESDRMPQGSSDPGYLEYNSGGIRIPGVNNLVRWPGRTVWQDPLFSAHFSDPDMPIKDAFGNGSCDNCHTVHGGNSAHDMLDTTYTGIAHSEIGTQTENYLLCLECHGVNGPLGMRETSKRIADYYDRAINPGQQSGHGVTTGSGYVPTGARLPCSDCHNPHGSQGYGNGGANAFLLSDQRPGWFSLTDIQNDNAQVRRFCFGCHKSSDLQGGGTVEGMALPPLPSTPAAHEFNHVKHCYDCHGRDYSTSNSRNIHNPNPGSGSGGVLQPDMIELNQIGGRRF